MKGLLITPFGPVEFRADRPPIDHGRLRRPHRLKDGKGEMADWRFVDGKD